MAGVLDHDARLSQIAVAQHGVFTRAQAIAVGFGVGRVDRRVRAGAWERVLPRVYRHAAAPRSAAQSRWAAVLWAGPGCALSHTSAAALWRIGPEMRADDRVELVVGRARAPRNAIVIVHRLSPVAAGEVIYGDRLPLTAPVRTIIDLAGVLPAAELEIALDRARARGLLTVRALRLRLDEIGTAGRPGTARLRALLAVVGSGRVNPSARMAG